MSRRKIHHAAVAGAALLAGCTAHTPTPPRPPAPHTAPPTPPETTTSTELAVPTTDVKPATTTVHIVATTRPRPATTRAPRPTVPAPVVSGSGSCGAPMPPCYVRQCESGGNYHAVSPGGHGGAWQFSRSTWDATARRAGRPDLVGVAPQNASPADQDAMAAALWAGGSGAGHWSCA